MATQDNDGDTGAKDVAGGDDKGRTANAAKGLAEAASAAGRSQGGPSPETASGQPGAGQHAGGQDAQPTGAKHALAGSDPGQKGQAQKAQTRKSPNQQGDGARQQRGGGGRFAATADRQGKDAISLLKADHRKAEALFAEYETADEDRKDEIVQELCHALTIHTLLEEEIFYPACREAASDEEALNEAQVEHDGAKLLIADLMTGDPEDEFRDAKVKVLAEQIRHHVAEEEGPSKGIFARAKAAGVTDSDLAEDLMARKQQLEAQADRLGPQPPVSIQRPQFSRSPEKEDYMPRNQERDERGRYSDDDRGGGQRSYGAERGGERRSFASNDRDRDDRGRFIDDDDRGGYRSRGGGSDGRGRGQGGWFGDSEGHSEASRRGWENPDHGRSGWYGDSRGHSEASRRGWENPDHGRSGWYGDPEGHSEASRRGWDERSSSGRRSYRDDDDNRDYGARGGDGGGGGGRSRDDEGRFTSGGRGGRGGNDDDHGYRSRGRDDDDDRGYRSRGREDDDDRGSRSRGGGGRGQGGWFGDSEGHSEAARRGWEDRR